MVTYGILQTEPYSASNPFFVSRVGVGVQTFFFLIAIIVGTNKIDSGIMVNKVRKDRLWRQWVNPHPSAAGPDHAGLWGYTPAGPRSNARWKPTLANYGHGVYIRIRQNRLMTLNCYYEILHLTSHHFFFTIVLVTKFISWLEWVPKKTSKEPSRLIDME